MQSYQTTSKKCHIKHIIPLITPTVCEIYYRKRLLSGNLHQLKNGGARIVTSLTIKHTLKIYIG